MNQSQSQNTRHKIQLINMLNHSTRTSRFEGRNGACFISEIMWPFLVLWKRVGNDSVVFIWGNAEMNVHTLAKMRALLKLGRCFLLPASGFLIHEHLYHSFLSRTEKDNEWNLMVDPPWLGICIAQKWPYALHTHLSSVAIYLTY